VGPSNEFGERGSPEQHPEPYQETPTYLPESYEEQRKLAERIDLQLEVWSSMASTLHFPAMRGMRMAEIIIRYGTPGDQTPEEFVNHHRFSKKWNDHEAEAHLRSEESRQAIARIIQLAEIEATPLENGFFIEAFAMAESYEQGMQASPEYSAALHYIKRLFIVREHLPKQPFIRDHHTNSHEFTIIMRRLIEDL
jgi:hypothetical protein